MDILLQEKFLEALTKMMLTSNDPQTTLLYFYSATAQSLAALFTVSGIFVIFRLQALDNQLNNGYEAFREWVSVRVNARQGDILAYQRAPLLLLETDIEPHSWLDKDIPDHLTTLYANARERGSFLVTALRDYHDTFRNILKYKLVLISFALLAMTFNAYLFYDSLAHLVLLNTSHLPEKLMIHKDVAFLIWSIKGILFVYLIIAVIAFGGMFFRNINNPLIHRRTLRRA